MIDLLTLNLCQSFAHKVKEKNGRQLTLSVGCCRYMKGGEAMCRVASNCLRPDGSLVRGIMKATRRLIRSRKVSSERTNGPARTDQSALDENLNKGKSCFA